MRCTATFPSFVIRLAGEFLRNPEFLSLSLDHIHVAQTDHVFYLVPGMQRERTLAEIDDRLLSRVESARLVVTGVSTGIDGDETTAAAPPAVHAPSGPASPAGEPPPSRHAVRIAFTADESFFRLMKEAQAAMRHKYPNGRLDGVFRDALEALLRKKAPWAYRKPR